MVKVLHYHTLSIKRFRLHCFVPDEYTDLINHFISVLLGRHVKEIELTLFNIQGQTRILPNSLFQNKELLKFFLHAPPDAPGEDEDEGEGNLDFVMTIPPAEVRFSSLKTIDLIRVTLLDDDSFRRVFVCCLLLKELFIMSLGLPTLNNVHLSNHYLHSVRI